MIRQIERKHRLYPNPLMNKTMVQTIEAHVHEHPFAGIFVAFIAGILGYIQGLPANPTTFETFCKLIGQISIIIGFIIALITLVIKCKELYITFFKKAKTTTKRKKAVSSLKED